MAAHNATDEDSKFEAHMEDFHRRVPDIALWYDTDVLKDHGEGWGVTVLVGGRLVSGQVASTKRWMDYVRRSANLTGDHPVSVGMSVIEEQLAESRANREEVEKWIEENDDDAELSADQKVALLAYSGFLHLIDARVLTDGQSGLVPNEGVAMRIRYSEIQGWSLGTMSVAK